MCHKLWAFSIQNSCAKKTPLASKKRSQIRFLALNRADAPCFCTKKKGSSNTHYTTLKYGKSRQIYGISYPKLLKNAQGLWHLSIYQKLLGELPLSPQTGEHLSVNYVLQFLIGSLPENLPSKLIWHFLRPITENTSPFTNPMTLGPKFCE